MGNKKSGVSVLAASMLSFIIFCGDSEVQMKARMIVKSTGLSQQKREYLASRKIYFGHQSVGFNIIDGIKTVLSSNDMKFPEIKEIGNAVEIDGPVFAHGTIGSNGNPKSKIDEFMRIMVNGMGEKVDIAFMKLCYIDIVQATDTDEIFEYYRRNMKNLQKRFPGVSIIHLTVPLTTEKTVNAGDRAKDIIKRILGRITGEEKNRGDNVSRQRFNEKMREEYAGIGLFDLAEIESTDTEGERVRFANGGSEYYALFERYSTDGGHLNTVGGMVLGDALLAHLAGISSPE